MNRVKVEDSRLTLPDGMNYRLLVLPACPTMTPQLLGKIRELVEARRHGGRRTADKVAESCAIFPSATTK